MKSSADFQRASQRIQAEFKDCSVTFSFIRFFILSYASSIHTWSITAATFSWISHWFPPYFSWFRWYVFHRMFCFLEDAAIKKIEASLLHELFQIQLRFSFVYKNHHPFLLMIPFNVDLVTFFGQYVQGWVHWGFSFYFSILVSTKKEFILYSATLHSRAKRCLWMWQAWSLFKPCRQPLLLLIAFIHPQTRVWWSYCANPRSLLWYSADHLLSVDCVECNVQVNKWWGRSMMLRKPRATYMRGDSSIDFTSAMCSCKCLWHWNVSLAVKTIALALKPWIGSLICSCFSCSFQDSCDIPINISFTHHFCPRSFSLSFQGKTPQST